MQDNPFNNPSSAGGFRPSLRPAPKRHCFVCVDAVPGGGLVETAVPASTRFIWNTLSLRHSLTRLKKGQKYLEVSSPLGVSLPPLPAGANPDDFTPMTICNAWLEGFDDHPAGLRKMTITGQICLNAMASLYELLTYKQEIQAGQLPVLQIHPFHDVETAYGTFGAPVLEIVGFVDYDVDVFGYPLLRPPPPILSSPPVPPQLSGGNGSEAPTSPANDAPVAVAPPANDPLATYRPIAARKPY